MTDVEKIHTLREALLPYVHFADYIMAGVKLEYIDPPKPSTYIVRVMLGSGSNYIWRLDLELARKAILETGE